MSIWSFNFIAPKLQWHPFIVYNKIQTYDLHVWLRIPLTILPAVHFTWAMPDPLLLLECDESYFITDISIAHPSPLITYLPFLQKTSLISSLFNIHSHCFISHYDTYYYYLKLYFMFIWSHVYYISPLNRMTYLWMYSLWFVRYFIHNS